MYKSNQPNQAAAGKYAAAWKTRRDQVKKKRPVQAGFSHTGGGGGADNLSRAAWRKAHPVMSAAEDKQGLKGTGGGNFSKGGKNYRWSKAAKAFTAQGRSNRDVAGNSSKRPVRADTNRPRFGKGRPGPSWEGHPTGGGVLNMDPRKRPIPHTAGGWTEGQPTGNYPPGLRQQVAKKQAVNQDFHAEQNSLKEHKPAHYSPEKPNRYRHANDVFGNSSKRPRRASNANRGGKFRKQTAAQIRKFRPSRRLKIHRNPNGMVR